MRRITAAVLPTTIIFTYAYIDTTAFFRSELIPIEKKALPHSSVIVFVKEQMLSYLPPSCATCGNTTAHIETMYPKFCPQWLTYHPTPSRRPRPRPLRPQNDVRSSSGCACMWCNDLRAGRLLRPFFRRVVRFRTYKSIAYYCCLTGYSSGIQNFYQTRQRAERCGVLPDKFASLLAFISTYHVCVEQRVLSKVARVLGSRFERCVSTPSLFPSRPPCGRGDKILARMRVRACEFKFSTRFRIWYPCRQKLFTFTSTCRPPCFMSL